MSPQHKLISPVLTSLAVVLALGAGARAASSTSTAGASTTAATTVHIGNFGKVDDDYYRGAQPDGADYGDLARLGVKTVIDLQSNGPSREKGLVEHAGMSFYRIPLTTSDRPSDAAV